VKTKSNHIFGGYATSAWSDTSNNDWKDYDQGNGTEFLFYFSNDGTVFDTTNSTMQVLNLIPGRVARFISNSTTLLAF
jgi:hypothetical protein